MSNALAELVQSLRKMGYVVLPASATEEVLSLLAESCFQAPDGKWEVALKDAAISYQELVEKCGL